MTRNALGIMLFIVVVTGFSAIVGWVGFTTALQPIADRGRADLSLAAGRLTSGLQQFRQAAVLLADHPDLLAVAAAQRDPAVAEAVLLEASDKLGTLEIFLTDAAGQVLASSTPEHNENVATAPYFERAMQGALGSYHAQLSGTGQRVFYFSAPMLEGAAAFGAVVVKVDLEAVEESDWRGGAQAIYFVDEAGVVFVSNRSELLLRVRQEGADLTPAGYESATLQPFFDFSAYSVAGHDLWVVDAGRYIPVRALHLVQPLPVIGMTGEVLISTAQAERIALLQAAVAAALCLTFGAIWYVATMRRNTLSERLALEAQTNARLEARVIERTHELSEVNLSLRNEIKEREEAELRLKKAQADLVQAGKLSALGEMSAGISHELNQPLMAIQNFAENAEVFLARGKVDVAGSNLNRISDLARRMGRIIKNLRAFSRQESEPISDVDLCAVVEAALVVGESRLQQGQVTIDWKRPDRPVIVRGGEVRLQQVVLNLVTNAADAMEGQENKQIIISLSQQADKVFLAVKDSGPGLDDPEKIFDPFYTTKAVGRAEGMGLGLSISYGLVQSFGGQIRGRNHAGGGAIFTVELAASKKEETA